MVPSLPLVSYESSMSVKENPDRKKKHIVCDSLFNYLEYLLVVCLKLVSMCFAIYLLFFTQLLLTFLWLKIVNSVSGKFFISKNHK